MSLLLDALKRAEAAKEANKQSAAPGEDPAEARPDTAAAPDRGSDTALDLAHTVEFDPGEPVLPTEVASTPVPDTATRPADVESDPVLELEPSDAFLALNEPPTRAPQQEVSPSAPTPRESADSNTAITSQAAAAGNADHPAAPRPGSAVAPVPPELSAPRPSSLPPQAPPSIPHSPEDARRVLAVARARQRRANHRRALSLVIIMLLLTTTTLGAAYLTLGQPTTAAALQASVAPPPPSAHLDPGDTAAIPLSPPVTVPAPLRVARETESADWPAVQPDLVSPETPPLTGPVTTSSNGGTTDAPQRAQVQHVVAAPPDTGSASTPLFRRSEQSIAATDRFADAYGALRDNRPAEALVRFRHLVARSPDDVEAQKGLALALSRSGDIAGAAAAYLAALAIDPRDPVAQAGLMATAGSADPRASLSRLRKLIADQPDIALLHFTLGSLLADAGNWPDAQTAYFDAHRLEPGNPIYAFNLAVSLEHLRQPALALDFYRRVKTLTNESAADNHLVDTDIVEARIVALSNAP